MGIPLQSHSRWCRCQHADCRGRGMGPPNRHHPALPIRHTVSRIDPPPTTATDNPAQRHPIPCLCRRPACQRRRTALLNRRPSATPTSHTTSRINSPPASSIYHPLGSYPVLSSDLPPSTFNTPTGQSLPYETNGAWLNSQASFSVSAVLPDSRSEQRNTHVQSGNSNSNAENHSGGMMGTHGNSSWPTNSPEPGQIESNIRQIRRLGSTIRDNLDNFERALAAAAESLAELEIMQEKENIVPTNPHTRQQERQSPSVRQEQSEYSGPRDIRNESDTSIRASNSSSLFERSNMPVSPVRSLHASQQMRDLSYSFGRFDEPLDEGGFHQSTMSQENSTYNYPRTRRQEVRRRPLAEQEQLIYFSLSPPRHGPELTNNFNTADRDSISPLLPLPRTEIEQFNVQQYPMYIGPSIVQAQARLRERARMEATQAPENKDTDLETNASTNNNTGS